MRRLKYARRAEQDLSDILTYITRESGTLKTGSVFIGALRDRCRKLAELPGAMGRIRDDIEPDLRSLAYKSYVIFFRYDEAVVEIVTIIHGMRDIDAVFSDD